MTAGSSRKFMHRRISRGVQTALLILFCVWMLSGCSESTESEVTGQLPEHAIACLGGNEFLPLTNTISQVAYSPEGGVVATVGCQFYGAVNEGVQFWEITTGKEIGPQELRLCEPVSIAILNCCHFF